MLVKKLIQSYKTSKLLRDGIRIAIVGPPNVGKSSLLNALAQRDAVIVSSRSGTTRDVVEVRLNLGGSPVILVLIRQRIVAPIFAFLHQVLHNYSQLATSSICILGSTMT